MLKVKTNRVGPLKMRSLIFLFLFRAMPRWRYASMLITKMSCITAPGASIECDV